MVFTLAGIQLRLVHGKVQPNKYQKTGKADLPAQRKRPVFVLEYDSMAALGQIQSYHGVADLHNLCSLTVYCCDPVAVLGDGGVENAVPVAVDGAFDTVGFKGGELQRGSAENLMGGTESVFVHDCCIDVDSPGFACFAGEFDLHHIAHLHIAYAEHLG